METTFRTLRQQDPFIPKPQKENIGITSRAVATYDRMARNLHHPSYHEPAEYHYYELHTLNRTLHDLNYPNPNPKPPKQKAASQTMTGTITTTTRTGMGDTKARSSLTSSFRSSKKYETRLSESILSNLHDQILVPKERVASILRRALKNAGMNEDKIDLVLSDITVDYVILENNSKIQILINL